MKPQCRVSARFHEVPGDLAPFFTTFCFGTVELDGTALVEDALHPEWGTLRFFPDAPPMIRIDDHASLFGARFIASGPTSQKIDYAMPASRFWGLGLLPQGWTTFVGTPASEMANRLVDGQRDETFAAFAPLADCLLDPQMDEQAQLAALIQFFRDQAPRHGRHDRRIARIHQCLLQPDLPNVAAMADFCGIGGRTLERLCRKAFGFPPKLLLRRQRFMRSLSQYMLDPEASWSASIDALYYDQSHFVRDSHRFLGMTPGEYAALDHPILEGFMRDRARDRGSPVQTLDSPAPDSRS